MQMKFSEFPKFGVMSSVNVLMSGSNIAGPVAASIMAESGAKVIQVEPPNMPCQTRGNYGYAQDHRNTYSMALNYRSERGKKVFEKLLGWADIWIESGRPGSYDKMGFSDERVWEINKKLAIVHVSGYGQYGPDKDKAAYDACGQAMGGYMYLNGTDPTCPPTMVKPYLGDYATALTACICGAFALINARATGEGDSVDVSQYESLMRLLGSYPADWFNRGYPGPGEPVKWRTGNTNDLAAGSSFYPCKDGLIYIGCAGVGNVKRGYPIFGLPEPGTGDPDFPEGLTGSLISLPRGQRIEEAIKKFCAERTVDEVERIMNENGIPNQRPYGPAEMEKCPHYAAREDLMTWEDTVYGEMRGLGVMNKYKKNPAQIVASAPLFGEHNREIMKDLGFSDEFTEEMYAAGELRTMDAKETAVYWNLREWDFFWREDQAPRVGLENLKK